MVHARSLVTALEFSQLICLFAWFRLNNNLVRCRTCNNSVFLCDNAVAGIDSRLHLHTCTHCRCLCNQQRHCLTLHVGSHQRTVRIIILQEWDHCCCDGEYHLRRHIHKIDLLFLKLRSLLTETTGYTLAHEMAFFIQLFVRLCNNITIFLICRQINNIVGNTRISRICLINFTIRCLDKSILINTRIRCQRVDQTDIRSFRSLYRTHASIMCIVYIADLETCTISGQTTRSQCRQTSLMCQFRKRIVLIHELWQLGTSKEFLHSSRYRLDIDQRLCRNCRNILCGHTFTNDTLHTG